MITVEQFKELIKTNSFDELLDNHILSGPTAHVDASEIEFIETTLRQRYSVPDKEAHFGVVGSAKLGFAINEKRLEDGTKLPRYRSFSALSDIDVAVVCPTIFNLIWNELSRHAHRSVTSLPWKSGALGDYLIVGWLRPDLFPNNVRLRHCDEWWDIFRSFSADIRFERRRVRGALFHSLDQLRQYQNRSLAECARAEAIKI